MYTVKQIANLAGVSIRTLHYYDEITLLAPTTIGENGYRYYDDAALFRLQQILFYRELGLELRQIRGILDNPEFELIAALQSHRRVISGRINRLQTLITTIDRTIRHIKGEEPMSNKQIFGGFNEEQEKRYTEEAAKLYGEERVRKSVNLWNSYTAEKKAQIKAEGSAIYLDLVAAMPGGPTSAETQAILARWHQHLRYFYEPHVEILRSLGQMYNQSPEFIANFEALHPDLPPFLEAAISHYCDTL
ncbi:MAG: MerR family transcriptional regulator [Anaerolineaceae bacterium]|nr:MerR family transcriptional regulator [Anaerolineaceae bacterium]